MSALPTSFDDEQADIQRALSKETGTDVPEELESSIPPADTTHPLGQAPLAEYPRRRNRNPFKLTIKHQLVGAFTLDVLDVLLATEGALEAFGVLCDNSQGLKFTPVYEQTYEVSWADKSVLGIYTGIALNYTQMEHATLLIFLPPEAKKD